MDIAYNLNDPSSDDYNNPYPYKINYKTASIAYEFTFDITEENNARASGTWGLPYTLTGDFSLTANGTFDRSRNTNRNFKLVDSFEELYNTDCRGAGPQPENLIYPISGEIGVYEVVRTFIKLQQVGNPKAGEVFTFADTLKFVTLLSAGVQPKLVIGPFPDRFRLAGASGDFNASRLDIHKVVISLAGEKPRIGDPKVAKAAPLGASLTRAADRMVGVQTNSSLLSTTLLQGGSNPKDRALLELVRQEIKELQNRSPNLLIGP